MSARAIRSRLRSEGHDQYHPHHHQEQVVRTDVFYPNDHDHEGEVEHGGTETQLAVLQEQLVAVMLENQNLADEVKVLREKSASEQLRQQLEREKEKGRILMERLQEREKGEREARDRERNTREKSLPAGDKSPSLPQRIRKRINQMHKTQSMDAEDGSTSPPIQFPGTSRLQPVVGDDQRAGGGLSYKPSPSPPNLTPLDNTTTSSSSQIVKSPSRSRFAWKRRGLEKSKSLDQSEFLASLNSTGPTSSSGDGEISLVTNTLTGSSLVVSAADDWMEDEQRMESDSDECDKGGQSDSGGGLSSETEIAICSVISSSSSGEPLVDPKSSWWQRLEVRLVAAVGELLRDFSEVAEEEQPDGDPEGDPLTVKKLKENILRFGSVMRPLTELSEMVCSLLVWESPSATLLALVVYLYCVTCGWLLTFALTFAILKLSLNYMKKRGWLQLVLRGLRRSERGETIEAGAGETGLGDKFALVLQVARRVQNQLGAVSNAAEKLKNLFLWEHEATQRLYFMLFVLLLASVFLPASQLFTIAGVYLGIKMFVMDYIFFRYPRIRLKYDSTSRLWDTLPTDADLENRGEKVRSENGYPSPDLTSFLELFNLPASESPISGWQGGRRCTLVNRDRSLTSAFKNGRLYLTNSYLCFERSKSHPVKNLKLPLKEVRLEKANSYPWIPGGGMAIEVIMEATGKGYFFAGILNRDEVYDGLLEGCRRAGATWIDSSVTQDRNTSNKDTRESRDNKDKSRETKDIKDVKDNVKDLRETKEAKDK